MMQDQQLLISWKAPQRQIRDIVTWVDFWAAYTRVVSRANPGRAAQLLSDQNVVLHTYRTFTKTAIWLRYDRNFCRKAACFSCLEIFHQSYAS